jgi:hypothetical protein
MPTTPLERLLFLQGGLCFFCSQPLPKADASVEHLHAVANGGTNHDDNCVACCKAVNRALGSMPLKAKIQVVLNQRGAFKCPNIPEPTPIALAAPAPAIAVASAPVQKAKKQPSPPPPPAQPKKKDAMALVVANLKQRGSSRPRTEKTLVSTITALLTQQKVQGKATDVIAKLVAAGKVTITDGKATYAL